MQVEHLYDSGDDGEERPGEQPDGVVEGPVPERRRAEALDLLPLPRHAARGVPSGRRVLPGAGVAAQGLVELVEHVELVAQVRRGRDEALHLARLPVHLLLSGVAQPVRVGAALDEGGEEGVEAAEQRVGAAGREARHGAGEVPTRGGHLGEREREERGVVVSDEAAHALEADGLGAEARELGVPERAPEAGGPRQERGDLEGQHAQLRPAAPGRAQLPHGARRWRRHETGRRGERPGGSWVLICTRRA